MKSDNLLSNIVDEDNIMLKLPTPNLILEVDQSVNNLVISGNFRMLQEISKLAYIGAAKNTMQQFTLSEALINFEVTDDQNNVSYSSKYEPASVISSTCLFVIMNKFKLPNDINLFNFNVKSFKIIANYKYGNNRISSIINLDNDSINIKYPIVLHNINDKVNKVTLIKEEKYNNIDEKEEEYNNIDEIEEEEYNNIDENDNKEHFTEHLEAAGSGSEPDPFFTLYWLIPVSLIICIGVYYYKNNFKKRRRFNFYDEISDFKSSDFESSDFRH